VLTTEPIRSPSKPLQCVTLPEEAEQRQAHVGVDVVGSRCCKSYVIGSLGPEPIGQLDQDRRQELPRRSASSSFRMVRQSR
jgi:hypothetical protein